MRRGSRTIGLERQDWAQFPQGALREALVNAVAHRDYTIRGEGIRIALIQGRCGEVCSDVPGCVPLACVTTTNSVTAEAPLTSAWDGNTYFDTPDGSLLAVGTHNAGVRLWNVASKAEMFAAPAEEKKAEEKK
jgi:hypothetical protein